jgi:hypothetical protein
MVDNALERTIRFNNIVNRPVPSIRNLDLMGVN